MAEGQCSRQAHTQNWPYCVVATQSNQQGPFRLPLICSLYKEKTLIGHLGQAEIGPEMKDSLGVREKIRTQKTSSAAQTAKSWRTWEGWVEANFTTSFRMRSSKKSLLQAKGSRFKEFTGLNTARKWEISRDKDHMRKYYVNSWFEQVHLLSVWNYPSRMHAASSSLWLAVRWGWSRPNVSAIYSPLVFASHWHLFFLVRSSVLKGSSDDCDLQWQQLQWHLKRLEGRNK